jgi:PAS domain S-box-containing protein
MAATRRRAADFAFLLPLAFSLLAGVFSGYESVRVFGPPFLLPLLNTVLLFAASTVLSVLAARSFIGHGSRAFFFLGCGLLSFGWGSLVSAWGVSEFGPNFGVTLHNVGSMLGGLFHCCGAVSLLQGRPSRSRETPRRATFLTAASYSAIILLFLLFSWLTSKGFIPPFFAQGQGPTLLRQVILTLAAVSYGLAALTLGAFNSRANVAFLSFYVGGLWLIAIGLFAALPEKNVGGLLGWIGRTAHYTASIYFAVAVITGLPRGPDALAHVFHENVERLVGERTRTLTELNRQLADEAAERKLMEAKLREREETYRQLIENSLQGIAILQDGRFVLANQTLSRMSGFSLEEMYRLTPEEVLATVHPDERPRVLAAQLEIMEQGGIIASQTIRLLNKGGWVNWVDVLAARTVYRGKLALQVTYLDVTERVKAEEPYHTLIDHSAEGFAILQDGRLRFANKALGELSGYSVPQLLELTAEDILAAIHPDERALVSDNLAAVFSGQAAPSTMQFRVFHREGSIRWLEILAILVEFHGRPAIGVSFKDVTQNRQAEEELRETEAKRRSLIDQSILGIALVDEAGRCIEWNKAMEAITGVPAGEALGRSFTDLQHLFQTGGSGGWEKMPVQALEFEAVLGGAEAVSKNLFVKYYPITVPHGLMFCLMVEDISAQKSNAQRLLEAQRTMRNLAGHLLRVREEERKGIAQEIHDELGQNLTALKMDLHWLAKRVGGQSEAIGNKTKDLIGLADQTLGMVQRISADLRPRMLDDLGLAEALDWLGKDFKRRAKIACTVSTTFPAERVGGNAATTIYRIVQEALTNVARHSRAKHAAVSVLVAGAALEVRIEDDGVGIPEEKAHGPSSFGLIGIRERAESLGGSFSISGEKGRGTVLQARIPLPPKGALA